MFPYYKSNGYESADWRISEVDSPPMYVHSAKGAGGSDVGEMIAKKKTLHDEKHKTLGVLFENHFNPYHKKRFP